MGQKIKEFLVTIPQYPFQDGAAVSPANVNYQTLKAMQALKQLETLTNPNNWRRARAVGAMSFHGLPRLGRWINRYMPKAEFNSLSRDR